MQILQDFNKPELMIRPLQPPQPGSQQAASDIQLLSQLKYGVPVSDVDEMLESKWNLRKHLITIPSRPLVTTNRSERPRATLSIPEVMTHYGI
jgi:hypothetical protein